MTFRKKSKDLSKRTREILALSKKTYETISYRTNTDDVSLGMSVTHHPKSRHEEMAHSAALEAYAKDFKQLCLDIQDLFGGRDIEVFCHCGRRGQNTPKITFSLLEDTKKHTIADNITSQTITKTLVTLGGFFETFSNSHKGRWAYIGEETAPNCYSLTPHTSKALSEQTLLDHLKHGPIAGQVSSKASLTYFHCAPSAEIQSLCQNPSPQDEQKQKDHFQLCLKWLKNITEALKSCGSKLGGETLFPAVNLVFSAHQQIRVTSHQPLNKDDQALILDALAKDAPEIEQIQSLVNRCNGTLSIEHNIRGHFSTCRLHDNSSVDSSRSNVLTHDVANAAQILSLHMWEEVKNPKWYAAFYEDATQAVMIQAQNVTTAREMATQIFRYTEDKAKIKLYNARILSVKERTQACQELQNALTFASSLFSS